jgi:hypothetical protein
MTNERRKAESIKKQLRELGAFLPGSLSKQYNVCGNPTCRCKDPKHPRRHGPYWQLSFTVNGRSSTRFIKPDELAEARLRLRRFKRFKALNARLTEAYIKLSRAENL